MSATAMPAVHLNGSSRAALLDQQREILLAARVLLTKLGEAQPHGRDYYVLPNGDEQLWRARAEHTQRVLLVESVIEDATAIAHHLLNGA